MSTTTFVKPGFAGYNYAIPAMAAYGMSKFYSTGYGAPGRRKGPGGAIGAKIGGYLGGEAGSVVGGK